MDAPARLRRPVATALFGKRRKNISYFTKMSPSALILPRNVTGGIDLPDGLTAAGVAILST